MFSLDLLKQKTNKDLRLLCKEHGIPQYGDKGTLISRILEKADQHGGASEVGGDGDRVDKVGGDTVEQGDEVDF